MLDSKPGMPRSVNESRQKGSRYGDSAFRLGTCGCTSQSMAAVVKSRPPRALCSHEINPIPTERKGPGGAAGANLSKPSYSLLADCRLEYLGDRGRRPIVGTAGPPQSRVERCHAPVVLDGHVRTVINQILDYARPSPLHRAE